MADPGSLQNLNDIVTPAAVAWWPPAPGWYAVLALLVVVSVWAAFRGLKSWRGNTYRRQALRELDFIRRDGEAAAGAIPELLKRAALSAWPREEVAGLTGREWHAFLDRSAGCARFSGTVEGELLDRLSCLGAVSGSPREALDSLLVSTEYWLKNHRVETD